MWASPEARGRFPFCVEAKARRKVSLFEAMRQCEKNTYDGYLPVVLSTYRGKTLATLPVEMFLAMVRILSEDTENWDDVDALAATIRDGMPRISGATFEDR
jgi:hypothetical protein